MPMYAFIGAVRVAQSRVLFRILGASCPSRLSSIPTINMAVAKGLPVLLQVVTQGAISRVAAGAPITQSLIIGLSFGGSAA